MLWFMIIDTAACSARAGAAQIKLLGCSQMLRGHVEGIARAPAK
jgi:hypothetical protein